MSPVVSEVFVGMDSGYRRAGPSDPDEQITVAMSVMLCLWISLVSFVGRAGAGKFL